MTHCFWCRHGGLPESISSDKVWCPLKEKWVQETDDCDQYFDGKSYGLDESDVDIDEELRRMK